MTEDVRRLLEELRKLSVEERAAIAAALLADLDGEPEADVAEAWAREIERRAADAISGKSQSIPWTDVKEGIRRKLGKS